MRNLTTAVALAIALIAIAGCGDAGREVTADSVLERAVASMGGDEVLAGVKALHLKFKGTFRQSGAETPYTSEMIFVWPDRALWTLDAGMFKGSMGMDGDTAWTQFMAPVARVDGGGKESFEEWPLHQDMMMVRPLLHRTGVTRRMGTTAEKGNLKLSTVHVAFDGKGEYALEFLTTKAGTFLSRIRGPQTMPDGRKGTMIMELSGPKAFGDVTMPATIMMKTRVGDVLEHALTEEILEVVWNPEVTDETFRMPDLGLELEKVSVREIPAGLALVVVHEGAYDKLSETFGKAFELAAQTGCMFTPQALCVYLNGPNDVSDPAEQRTEVIVALTPMGPPPTEAPEGAELRSLPAVKVAAMTVRGPYGQHEGKTIREVFAWVGKERKTPAGPPRVLYMHNPALTFPEDQVSEVQVPLAE